MEGIALKAFYPLTHLILTIAYEGSKMEIIAIHLIGLL